MPDNEGVDQYGCTNVLTQDNIQSTAAGQEALSSFVPQDNVSLNQALEFLEGGTVKELRTGNIGLRRQLLHELRFFLTMNLVPVCAQKIHFPI
jgi:hypothetical protein